MATDMQTQHIYSCGHRDRIPNAEYFIRTFTSYPCPKCKKRGIKGKSVVMAQF